MDLCLLQISFNSSYFIFELVLFSFKRANIFLNWINKSLSKQSYSSIALCLYLFNANLLTGPRVIPAAPLFESLDTLDILDTLDMNFSFWVISLPEFSFSSSSWSPFKRSFIPLIAPSQSIFESTIYFDILSHNVSFSSWEFHISNRSMADKNLSNSSWDVNAGFDS